MLFHFQLDPLDEIAPWTTPSQGNAKSLHWFGLTSGRYWLEAGETELFRHSPTLLDHWQKAYPGTSDNPYVDYFVVRLWEDVLEILPSVLDSIPDDLACHIKPGGIWESWADWKTWTDEAFTWVCDQEPEEAWNFYSQAIDWWSNRKLDAGYLQVGPGIWFWREDDTIHVQWDNSDLMQDSIPVWSAQTGTTSFSATDFIEEVRSFDARLIRAMAERVDAVRQHWSRPEIRIDREALRKEHHYRMTMFENALTNSPRPTDWDAVRAALTELERQIPHTRARAKEKA